MGNCPGQPTSAISQTDKIDGQNVHFSNDHRCWCYADFIISKIIGRTKILSMGIKSSLFATKIITATYVPYLSMSTNKTPGLQGKKEFQILLICLVNDLPSKTKISETGREISPHEPTIYLNSFPKRTGFAKHFRTASDLTMPGPLSLPSDKRSLHRILHWTALHAQSHT